MRTLALIFLTLLSGCATYEFDITHPPEFSRHISRKADESFTRDDLDYRLRAVEGRLVVRIYNTADNDVRILGARSTLVDPHLQSRPIRSQTIAPGAFVKLILPPLAPQLRPSGPSITIGGGISSGGGSGIGLGTGFHDGPDYYEVDDNSGFYWEWDGASDVRLTLTFERAAQIFTHTFAISRVKL